jgi:hypothetical protein
MAAGKTRQTMGKVGFGFIHDYHDAIRSIKGHVPLCLYVT